MEREPFSVKHSRLLLLLDLTFGDILIGPSNINKIRIPSCLPARSRFGEGRSEVFPAALLYATMR